MAFSDLKSRQLFSSQPKEMTVICYLVSGGYLMLDTFTEKHREEIEQAARVIRTKAGGQPVHVLQNGPPWSRLYVEAPLAIARVLKIEPSNQRVYWQVKNMLGRDQVVDPVLLAYLQTFHQRQPRLVLVTTKAFLGDLIRVRSWPRVKLDASKLAHGSVYEVCVTFDRKGRILGRSLV